MENYANNKIISVVGDESRYQFARIMIGEMDCVNYANEKSGMNFIFINSGFRRYIQDEKNIMVYTDLVQIGRVIEIPAENFSTKSICGDRISDKVLLFNTFPYAKLNLLDSLEEMVEAMPMTEFEVVLYKEKRKFLSTDISSIDEAMEFAKLEYMKFASNVVVFRPENRLDKLFIIHQHISKRLKMNYSNLVEIQKNRFKMRFDITYSAEIEDYINYLFDLLNPDDLLSATEVFSFEMVKDKADIWSAYKSNFERIYLFGNYDIINRVAEFYFSYVEGISCLNQEDEREKVEEILLEKYNKFFEYRTRIFVPQSEIDYLRLVSKTGLCEKFLQRIQSFAKDGLKNVLYDMINNKIKCGLPYDKEAKILD